MAHQECCKGSALTDKSRRSEKNLGRDVYRGWKLVLHPLNENGRKGRTFRPSRRPLRVTSSCAVQSRRMSETHANYLRDLGRLLRQAAIEAARDSRASRGNDDASYKAGRSFAYYEVVSLMEQQAKAFGISIAEIGFEGFKPDQDAL